MAEPTRVVGVTRRELAGAGAGLLAVAVMRPVAAGEPDFETALREIVGEAPLNDGRVKLDIPPLVENGNVVPVTVTVESPMSETDYVRRVSILNEKNPQAYVADFHLGPRAGRAEVATRMRLATSQTVTAIALLSDGSFWVARADVIVTLAACVES